MAKAVRTILLIWVLLVVVTACASRSPSLSSASDDRGATAQGDIAGPTSDANSNRAETTGSGSHTGATLSGSTTLLGSTTIDATPSSAAAPSAPPAQGCTKADQQLVRVPQLLVEGKLHRTLRVIDHANRLCPETAMETWFPELQILAEIGRYQAARELADKILATSPSSAVRTRVE